MPPVRPGILAQRKRAGRSPVLLRPFPVPGAPTAHTGIFAMARCGDPALFSTAMPLPGWGVGMAVPEIRVALGGKWCAAFCVPGLRAPHPRRPLVSGKRTYVAAVLWPQAGVAFGQLLHACVRAPRKGPPCRKPGAAFAFARPLWRRGPHMRATGRRAVCIFFPIFSPFLRARSRAVQTALLNIFAELFFQKIRFCLADPFPKPNSHGFCILRINKKNGRATGVVSVASRIF